MNSIKIELCFEVGCNESEPVFFHWVRIYKEVQYIIRYPKETKDLMVFTLTNYLKQLKSAVMFMVIEFSPNIDVTKLYLLIRAQEIRLQDEGFNIHWFMVDHISFACHLIEMGMFSPCPLGDIDG